MKRFLKQNAFLLIILSLFAIGIVGLTRVDTNACKTGVCYDQGITGNSYWKCPCGGPRSKCVTSPMCQGHRWSGSAGTDFRSNGDAISPTCTSQGRTASQTAIDWKYCVYCYQNHYFTPRTVAGQPLPALGHQFSQNNWSRNGSQHWITCNRRCGSTVGNNSQASSYTGYTASNIYYRENHYEGSEQNGGHYWNYYCAACGQHMSGGVNASSVTIYYPDGQTYSGSNGQYSGVPTYSSWLTAPAYTNNGYHVYGLHKGSNVTFHHVNQDTGNRPATQNGIVQVVDGNTISQSLCYWNQRYHGYDICNNHYGRNGMIYSYLAADVEYNFVTVNYRTGYLGDEILRTRYVDTTQTLTTENYTLIPNRQGYDVADNGWFETKADTALYYSSWCKCNKGYDNYKSAHRMHFMEDYGKMYRFNTNYGPTYYNEKVSTTAYTTRDLYPRWRAHALTINYDVNGGTNKPNQQIMYYSDGKSFNENGNPTTYNLTQTVPTRAGYTFMGWGNAARWDNCTSGTKSYDVYGELNEQTRYSYNSANAMGYWEDYNGNQTRAVSSINKWSGRTGMTAEAWAAFGGQDLRTGDKTITLYAQWERVIRYAFYHYNDASDASYYTVSKGYRDVNYATVAFHNSDAEYLYMDILANDTNASIVSQHGKNTTSQKNIETTVSFNYSADWQARGFAKTDSSNAKIDNGNLDVNAILPLNTVYDKSNFFVSKNKYWNNGSEQHTSWNKTSCHDVSNVNVNEKLYHVTNGNTNTGNAKNDAF